MIWLNGEFRDDSAAVLSWHDTAFTHGATVVDNCRTWGGRLFRWHDHMARFACDCNDCRISLPSDPLFAQKLEEIALKLLHGHDDRHVITVATPGMLGMMTAPVDHARNERLYSHGAELVVAGHYSTAADSLLPPRVKHRSRMHWHIAGAIARERNAQAMAVLLDRPGGTLTETAIGHVLAVDDGEVLVPPRATTLDGIGLRVMLELCERLQLRVRECTLPADCDTDELLLSGSGFGICGVRTLDDRTWPVPGPITERLMHAWSAEVGETLLQRS